MTDNPHYLDLLTKEFFEQYYVKRKMSYPQIQKMLKEKGYNIHPGTLYSYAKKFNIGRGISEGKRAVDPNSLDYNKTYITDDMIEYVDGVLLGDGGINPNLDSKVARFCCSLQYEEFANYLMAPFKSLGSTVKKGISDRMKQGFGFGGSTRFHPDLYKQYLRWYPEKEPGAKYRCKQPPDDVKITPWSVQAWYLGDGSVVVGEKSILVRLSTDGFAPDKVLMLVEKLKEKGILSHRNRDNRIVIDAKGIPAFFNFIGHDSPISPVYNYKFDRIKEVAPWRFESKRMSEVSEELNISYSKLCYLVKEKKIDCFRLSKNGKPRFMPEHIEKIKEFLSKEENLKKVKENKKFYTEEFSYLVGSLLGDGCLYINKKNGTYQFSITSEDKDFCEKCQDIAYNIFGNKGKIIEKKNSYYQLRVCSKEIVYFLKDLTDNKTIIPNFIYTENNFKRAFIRGIMDSDGWICRVNASDEYIRYRVGFKNTALWAGEIKNILTELGVKTGGLREVLDKRASKKAYTFSINTYDYCTKVGFWIERKKKIVEEFLEFYKNGNKKDVYKNYRFLKECPICHKEYDEHWKVVNHIRKTKDNKHQEFLERQEKEVLECYLNNDKKRWMIKKELYKRKNIFAGISYEKIMRIIDVYISSEELEKIRKERISKTLKDIPKTLEHNKKVSIAVKKAWKEGKFNTEEYKEAKRIGLENRRSFAGKGNPMYSRTPGKGAGRGKGGYREDIGMYVRSTWEANLTRVFNLFNRSFSYEPKRFYIIIDGRELSYLPDFYFSDKDIYYEIKGHARSSRSWNCTCEKCVENRLKIQAVKEKYNIKIFIIGHYEYLRLKRKFKHLIPNWE